MVLAKQVEMENKVGGGSSVTAVLGKERWAADASEGLRASGVNSHRYSTLTGLGGCHPEHVILKAIEQFNLLIANFGNVWFLIQYMTLALRNYVCFIKHEKNHLVIKSNYWT